MHLVSTLIKFTIWLTLSVMAGSGMLITAVYLFLSPTLPDIKALKNIDLQTPLRIYSSDERLISEFGEKRRSPISIEETPQIFIDALLASEDDGFYRHGGIDYKGLTRATIELITTGKKKSGGSTITMQVAKNYYLSSEKTFTRKFTEILLALKIERFLTKNEILELYLNKIYLGKRAYGIEAAAQVYYGKSINDLSLAQIAMIAGLPQAPSAANPIRNPQRAIKRRNHVLNRMLKLEKISQEAYYLAVSEPVSASYHGVSSEMEASYLAEMVRQDMLNRFGKSAYTEGYRVYTTVSSERQSAANQALQRGLLKYDRDHGRRERLPPLDFVYQAATADTIPEVAVESALGQVSDELESIDPLSTEAAAEEATDAQPLMRPIDWSATLSNWDTYLTRQGSYGIITSAIVKTLSDDNAVLHTLDGEVILPFAGMAWAAPYITVNKVGDKPQNPAEVLIPGEPIWIEQTATGWRLAQLPEAESALVAMDPQTGSLQSLVGGFSYFYNKFNRATQAKRQPGSAFKPFIYSAALANGYTPATIINDAPVVFEDASLENTWRPENHGGKFYGPTRLREALYKSQNLVSIRILKDISPRRAIRYIAPFGFEREQLNSDLSLALGASAVTPWQLATAYCALANGGQAIEPYFIERIEDRDGQVIYQHEASEPVPVMDERTHFLTVSMLQDVIKRGTGKKALVLGRNDLAGKTGTTNDQKDAWFAGFNPELVTAVWVGFDRPSTLGRWAFGGTVALPIWIDYMATALAESEDKIYSQPSGVVSVRIDPKTGKLAYPGQSNAIFEYFRDENRPAEMANNPFRSSLGIITGEESNQDGSISSTEDIAPEQLF